MKKLFTFKTIFLILTIVLSITSCTDKVIDVHHLDQLTEEENPKIPLGMQLGYEFSKMTELAEKNGAFKHSLDRKLDNGFIESIPDGYAYKPFNDNIIGRLQIELITIDGKDIVSKLTTHFYNNQEEFIPRIFMTHEDNTMIVDITGKSQDEILELVNDNSGLYRTEYMPVLTKADIDRLIESFETKYGKTTLGETNSPDAYHLKYKNGMYRRLHWVVGEIEVTVEIDDFCDSPELDEIFCGYADKGYSLSAQYKFNDEVMKELYKEIENQQNNAKTEEVKNNF